MQSLLELKIWPGLFHDLSLITIGFDLLVGTALFHDQLKLVRLTFFIMSGCDDRLERRRVESRRRQRHDGEVAGGKATDGLCDAVASVVAYLEYFLKRKYRA
jgi:hypothetical protein